MVAYSHFAFKSDSWFSVNDPFSIILSPAKDILFTIPCELDLSTIQLLLFLISLCYKLCLVPIIHHIC